MRLLTRDDSVIVYILKCWKKKIELIVRGIFNLYLCDLENFKSQSAIVKTRLWAYYLG